MWGIMFNNAISTCMWMFCVSFSSKEGIDLNGASRRHHLRHLPPVTPTECIRDTVISIIFDQLWSEVLY